MKIKSILLGISLLIIFSCKPEIKEDSNNKLDVSHEKNEKIDEKKNFNNDIHIESKCFTKDDLQKVDLLFKSIIKKNIKLNSFFVFEEKDLTILKRELTSDNFESYLFKNKNIKCDSYLSLEIFYRDKFDDGNEVHYSERSRMYRIFRNNNELILKFLATAG